MTEMSSYRDHANGSEDGSPAEGSDAGSIPPGVTPLQVRAADLLAQGCGPTEVAQLIGRSREQLWRWRPQDAAFKRVLAAFKMEYHQARVERLFSLTDPAMEVVAESLREGDPVVAMQVLRLVAPSLTDIRLFEAPEDDREEASDDHENDGEGEAPSLPAPP